MASVVLYDRAPVRYRVIFKAGPTLDDSDFSVVEAVPQLKEGGFHILCLRHMSTDCMCSYEVEKYRGQANINDSE